MLAGTLDILSAFVYAAEAGGTAAGVLRTVASGPFGDAAAQGAGGVPLGLAVHFAIMAAMVAVYMVAAARIPALNRHWWIAGPLYGLALWLAMYHVVLPLRWAEFTPSAEPAQLARQWFSHLVLVGLPIAWIASRRTPPGPRRD